MPDNGGQYPGGDPGSAGGQSQGGEEKTTLWYDLFRDPCHSSTQLHGKPKQWMEERLTSIPGWASSSHGSMKTSYVQFGTTWVNR